MPVVRISPLEACDQAAAIATIHLPMDDSPASWDALKAKLADGWDIAGCRFRLREDGGVPDALAYKLVRREGDALARAGRP